MILSFGLKQKVALIFLLLSVMLAGCKTEQEASVETYSELKNPAATDTSRWEEEPEGLHAAFGTTDKRYPKEQVPEVEGQKRWSGRSWRGERTHAQIVLWAAQDIQNVEVAAGGLKTDNGDQIAQDQLQAQFVRYVMTDNFKDGCSRNGQANYDSSLSADMLDPLPKMDIQGLTARPVWLTINVPQDAKAGSYHGNVEVKAGGETTDTLNITLEVSSQQLPLPDQWAFHLDLWQNPFAVARYNNVELWSEEHWELLKPLLEMLADAGQKSITVSALDSPWGGQTYDSFKSMIKWTWQKDGSWSYDYSIFDQWVSFAKEAGITDQISIYSMIPWGNEYRYYDENKGQYATKRMQPGTKQYNAHWRPFLEDFARHLKEKGWFEETNIAFDERPLGVMKSALKLIQEVEPEFKVTLAGNYHKEIASEINDLSINLSQDVSEDVIQKRNETNKITTFYTTCGHEKPNTFTFSKPAQATWYAWYAASRNMSGFLRWAYNSWVKQPLKDSRFGSWSAGDTYQVYPGARSSIRFERLREGIQDFEKIRILKEKLHAKNTPQSKKDLQQLENMLDQFKIKQLDQEKAGEMIRHGREVLKTIEKQVNS